MKKTKENRKAQWRSILVLVLITVLAAAGLSIPIVKNRKAKAEEEKKLEALLESKSEAEGWSRELQEMKDRGLTTEEIEEIARAKFGFVYDDEIVLMPEDE